MTFRASVHIYLCGPVLGVVVPSRSGESVNFMSASRIDHAHRSPSSLGVSECVQLPLADQVRLETYGRVGHAIGSGQFFQLRSRPFLD